MCLLSRLLLVFPLPVICVSGGRSALNTGCRGWGGQFHETRGLHAVGFGTHGEATNIILRDYSAVVAYILLFWRLLLPILLFTVVFPGRWLQRTRCTCLIQLGSTEP